MTCDQDYHHVRVHLLQRRYQLYPFYVRQLDLQECHIEEFTLCFLYRFLPRSSRIDLIALLYKYELQGTAGALIVINDQDAAFLIHATPPPYYPWAA